MTRVLVIVPTYNEALNIRDAVEGILSHVPSAHVLVADDNSPDGTGALADAMSARDERVHVLHRPGKEGLGAAYLDGFRWALARDYDVVVEMDADGSHRPEDLPALLDVLTSEASIGLVLGSRWIPGGQVLNWPRRRLMLSRGGNLYTKAMLGLPIADATGGFRAFRAETLRGLDLSSVQSQGYCFQVDLARRAVAAGVGVREVPITFVERQQGVSKMNGAIVREALWRVTLWGAQRLLPASRSSG